MEQGWGDEGRDVIPACERCDREFPPIADHPDFVSEDAHVYSWPEHVHIRCLTNDELETFIKSMRESVTEAQEPDAARDVADALVFALEEREQRHVDGRAS